MFDRVGVLARRMATQRIVGRPLPGPAAVVELLCCVQSQEFGHALWSLGMRSTTGSGRGPSTGSGRGPSTTTQAEILAAFDAGDLLRTHILRPTWHLVAPADLGWILAATSDRVHGRNTTMYRQTGIDERTVARTAELITEMLAGGRSLTRAELGDRLAASGVEAPTGMRLTHLVMRAELDGLIVSGPLRGNQHTYALVAERLAGRIVHRPDDPIGELWRRYVIGHGPTSVRDFARWSSLTLTAARAAARRVAEALQCAEIEGEELWWDPSSPAAHLAGAALDEAAAAVRLIPLYDELTLSYPRLGFPLAAAHPHPPDADTRWGCVISGLCDVGVWRRTLTDSRRTVRLAVALAPHVSADQRVAVDAELDRLAEFLNAEPIREEWNSR